MRDRKFGWHVIWMTPVVLIWALWCKLCAVIRRMCHHVRMKWVLYRNPEIKRMSELAGVHKSSPQENTEKTTEKSG